MPRAPREGYVRKLSETARKEHDPKKFVHILKQLYNVLNEEEERETRGGKRWGTRGQTEHEQRAA
jgi:hypothetical protein